MVTPLQPLIDLAGIEHEFDRLLDSLLALLDEAGRGVRRLTLTACRADGLAIRHAVGLARAGRDAVHVRRLFAEHLPGIDPGHGIDTLILSADVTEVLVPEQTGMAGPGQAAPALERLVDRIANRLHPAAVHRFAPVDSHMPERAMRRAGPLVPGAWRGPGRERPLTLLDRPEPIAVIAEIPEGPPITFRWRRVVRRTARAAGPERIAPEWWRDPGDVTRTRDYYTVEDMTGRRYWLYRDGLYHEQAVHGVPEWYLHGLFA